MSERVAKVESVIQQVVAMSLRNHLEGDAASVTVTRVDASPDLHNATVWIGLLTSGVAAESPVWKRIMGLSGRVQHDLGQHMTNKYVPRIHFKLDTGGAYAAEIDRLLRKI
jgi:ribosome-binding factor A